METWDLVILVDATQRGGAPGSLYVIEPDLAALESDESPLLVETHAMRLTQALRSVKALGGALPRLLLIGCEPLDLGDPEEGKLGLSDPVAAAAAEVPSLVDSLLERLRGGEPQVAAPDPSDAPRGQTYCNQAATD
jgi:hydrogenase maturation protease